MAVIYDLVSVQMIALLGSDGKLLNTSPDPSFLGQIIEGDIKEPKLLFEKSREVTIFLYCLWPKVKVHSFIVP